MSNDATAAEPLLRALDLMGEIAELARKHDQLLWHQPHLDQTRLTVQDLASVRAAVEDFQESLPAVWESDRGALRAWRRGRGELLERLVPLKRIKAVSSPPCRADEAVQVVIDFDARLRKILPVLDDHEPFDVEDFLEDWDTASCAVAEYAPTPEVLARLRAEVLEEFGAASGSAPAEPSPSSGGVQGAVGRAIVGLLDGIAGILELARGPGLAAEPTATLDAKERLRAAFPAAIDAPILAVRLLHRPAGGVQLNWYEGMSCSYSDAVLDVGADLMDRLSGASYDADDDEPVGWRRDLSEWTELVAWILEDLDEVPIGFGDLADLVRDEHTRAESVELFGTSAFYFEDGAESSIVSRRTESIALLKEFRIPVAETPGAGLDEGEAVVEQLFFVPGEAPHQFLTKIGGTPYRLADVPWPTSPTGRPLTFLAQFYVAPTFHLFPDGLYGDLLLIFAETESDLLVGHAYPDGLHFEWWQLGALPSLLVRAKDVPKTGWRIKPYFGVHLCTGDRHLVGPSPYIKVGGWPDFLQGGPRHGYYSGEFLLQFARPQLVPTGLDRWAHLASPSVKGREITIGDDGYLFLFLRADETIDWYSECY